MRFTSARNVRDTLVTLSLAIPHIINAVFNILPHCCGTRKFQVGADGLVPHNLQTLWNIDRQPTGHPVDLCSKLGELSPTRFTRVACTLLLLLRHVGLVTPYHLNTPH